MQLRCLRLAVACISQDDELSTPIRRAEAAPLPLHFPGVGSLAGLLQPAAGEPVRSGAVSFFLGRDPVLYRFYRTAWLYGFYNVGVVIFARIYSGQRRNNAPTAAVLTPLAPAVAILYTSCNDFVEASADSCVAQDYPNFTVYILDDSSSPEFEQRIDIVAAQYPERVRVVRRGDRSGYKPGNINYGLTHAATQESVFALVDADELLPRARAWLLSLARRLRDPGG